MKKTSSSLWFIWTSVLLGLLYVFLLYSFNRSVDREAILRQVVQLAASDNLTEAKQIFLELGRGERCVELGYESYFCPGQVRAATILDLRRLMKTIKRAPADTAMRQTFGDELQRVLREYEELNLDELYGALLPPITPDEIKPEE